jgi:hypothetical protein
MLISFDGDWIDPRRITRMFYDCVDEAMIVCTDFGMEDGNSFYVIANATQEYVNEKAKEVNDALRFNKD